MSDTVNTSEKPESDEVPKTFTQDDPEQIVLNACYRHLKEPVEQKEIDTVEKNLPKELV